MQISSVRELLVKLATNENTATKIGKVLAYYYPNISFSDKKGLFESLMNYYKLSSQNETDFSSLINVIDESKDLSTYLGKDLRIQAIEISAVRGIPEKTDGHSFGISFIDEGAINNAVILANNGVGKSSVFSAIEMIYAQEISEKRLRSAQNKHISYEEYNEYLERFPLKEKPTCTVYTPAGKFDFDNIVFKAANVRKAFNPSNHFISDFDIYHYGQKEFDGEMSNNNSFHSLIANSLGLGEFIQVQTLLKETSTYRRSTETGNLKKLENQKAEAEINIKNLKSQVQLKTEEIGALKTVNNIEELNKNKEGKIKQLQELYRKDLEYGEYSDYRNLMDEFRNAYIQSLSVEGVSHNVIETSFLQSGLDLIHEFDNCPFCLDSKHTREEIKKEVEERIESIKTKQSSENKLKSLYGDLSHVLLRFYKETENIYNEINKERSITIAFKELENIFKEQESIYLGLSLVISDYELLSYVDNLRTKAYPQKDDYKALFNLIEQDIVKQNFYWIIRIKSFLAARQQAIESAIKSMSVKDDDSSQKIVIAEEDIKRIQAQIDVSEKLVENLNRQIIVANQEANLVFEIKKDINDFLPLFDIEVNKLVNEGFEPIKSIVERIMTDYLQKEPVKLKIDRKEQKEFKDGEELISYLIIATLETKDINGNNLSVSPDKYFNTFRYKLFCLMISLSLALATRKRYKINIPIVIDDIFFSSDFVNKNTFSIFLQDVIKIFYEQTPELPLQFILFTHDDLIFRSALDAIDNFRFNGDNSLCEENKKPLIDKTLIGRFFDPNDRDKEPTDSQFSGKYWNLMYNIPKKISV